MAADPKNDDLDAWLVATMPDEYTEQEHTALLKRGMEQLSQDDRYENRVAAIEAFGVPAIERGYEATSIDDIIHDDPGELTSAAVLSTIATELHPRYRRMTDGYYDPSQALLDDIKRTWVEQVNHILWRHEDRQDIFVSIAEELYARTQEDVRGPPGGRVCDSIAKYGYFDDDDVYVRLSIEHMNSSYLVTNEDGVYETRLYDGYVHVPISDFQERLIEQLEKAFAAHHHHATQNLYDQDDRERVQSELREIETTIRIMIERKDYDKLFDSVDRPQELDVVISAVADYNSQHVAFGEWVTAEDIYSALTHYRPKEYEKRAWSDFESPMVVSQVLVEYEDHDDVEIDREGRVNKFRLKNRYQDYVNVTVEHPRDLLELPCLANLDEYLRTEGKPNRNVLVQVARIMISMANDWTKDEMAEFFEPYEWYDPEITKYQIGYEMRQTTDAGNDPPPIGCRNETNEFMQFCIGIDNCNYSIYGSLNFKDKVYDQLPDRDEEERTLA